MRCTDRCEGNWRVFGRPDVRDKMTNVQATHAVSNEIQLLALDTGFGRRKILVECLRTLLN